MITKAGDDNIMRKLLLIVPDTSAYRAFSVLCSFAALRYSSSRKHFIIPLPLPFVSLFGIGLNGVFNGKLSSMRKVAGYISLPVLDLEGEGRDGGREPVSSSLLVNSFCDLSQSVG